MGDILERSAMPKISVEIEWDTPDDPHWLNRHSIKIALEAHCKSTHFTVTELTPKKYLKGCPECSCRLVQVEKGHFVSVACTSCDWESK